MTSDPIEIDPALLEDVKEHSEEMGDGMTNAVYRVEDERFLEEVGVEDDTVVLKEYDDDPFLSLAVTHYDRLGENLGAVREAVVGDGPVREGLSDIDLTVRDYVSVDERVDNEYAAIRELDATDFTVPDVVYDDGEGHVAFEEVEGTPLPDHVEESSLDEVYETAKDVGQLTAAMHEEDVVKMDNRMENVLVQEDGYASIDWEYTITDADAWDKAADMITFVSSAKQLDRDRYAEVRSGFMDGYEEVLGEDAGLERYQKGLTVLTSTLHPGAEAVKNGEVRESAEMFGNAVSNNVKDGFEAVGSYVR